MIALLAALLAAVPGGAATPNGQFVVVAAPRHPAVTNMQAAYRPDDPQLVGRLVSFDGAALSFDGSYLACARATRSTMPVAAGALMRRLFPDRPSYGRTRVTRPSDFALPLAPTRTVPATRFRCLAPLGHHGDRWTGATLFPIGNGRWALSLIQDHLLILRPATGAIRASFNCAKAGSLTERTICSDRLLAGWDLSVAAAYQQGGASVEDQRAWLRERDRCGGDKACLHESLSLRTTNLLH